MYTQTFQTDNGDVVIRDNDLVLISGQEELRQNIENRLSVNTGEWFLNVLMGLDYQKIIGKGVDDDIIDFAIRECCLQDNRVKTVIVNSIERKEFTRQAEIDITIIDKNDEELSMKEVVDIG